MTDKVPNLLEVIKSVLASFFGVQSDKIRKRDFEKGNPMQFIAVGIILTVILIASVISIVKLILYVAT